MHAVHADDFSSQKCQFSVFLTEVPYFRVYGVTSVERGHLAD